MMQDIIHLPRPFLRCARAITDPQPTKMTMEVLGRDGGEAPSYWLRFPRKQAPPIDRCSSYPQQLQGHESTNGSDYLIRVAHTVLTCDEDSRAWRMQMPDRMARPERFELPTLRFEA